VQVLWWLVPPLMATSFAMIWAAWAGRDRDDVRRHESDDELVRMQQALARPGPRTTSRLPSRPIELTHGVAIRRSVRPTSVTDPSR
jgi:hypothetical protein